MSFYQRYISGEYKVVYDEILQLKDSVFLPELYSEIEPVLDETFNRVSHNLKVIYRELGNINYLFKTDFNFTSDKPLAKPFSDADLLINLLDETVAPFGYVPVSLKKFYQIVGSCNFVWDYGVNEDRFWECADPVQICSLDDLVSYVTDEDWKETMTETLEESEKPYLELAADYLHKDNISGGMPYSLEITNHQSIDALFLFEPHNTTFINYLRICFENCGFSQISKSDLSDDFKSFFSRVKPQLLKI